MNTGTFLPWLKARQRGIWLMLAASFILPFSLYTMLCFIVGSDFLGMHVRSLGAMLGGTAITPHVYRQLVPVMANSLIAVTPESVQTEVTQFMHAWLYAPGSLFATAVRFRHPAMPPRELSDPFLFPFTVVVTLDFLFLLGYVCGVWLLARRLYPQYFSMQVIAPCLAILAIPPLCARFAYIYDFPVLCFSAWLSYALVRKRLWMLTIGIGLATLNKETSLYLIAVFALYGRQVLPRREWAFHLLCQGMLFVLVKGAVTLYYQGNPGEFLWTRGFYDHIITNLDGYAVYTFLGIVAAIALLGYRFAEQPLIMQCWLPLLPFSVLSWLVFGMRNEYRVMYEMFPALILMASHTLARVLEGRKSFSSVAN